MKAARLFHPALLIAVTIATAWAGLRAEETNRPTPVWPLPVRHSPVEAFRRLLVMPTAERREYLEGRNSEVRTRLVEKIREYQALTPEEREIKLKATELRWYLEPLLVLSPTNRTGRLALIPESMREMVNTRLQQWDKLPAGVQQVILTNRHGPAYVASVITTNSPPSPINAIRRTWSARYEKIFDLTPAEQESVLARLSDAERRQMEKTLEAFGQLPPPQRLVCMRSFKKFVGMSGVERQEFLKNAERWSKLSPSERQAWRELVSAAPNLPPLPIAAVPRPPIPVNPRKPAPAPTTNGG